MREGEEKKGEGEEGNFPKYIPIPPQL